MRCNKFNWLDRIPPARKLRTKVCSNSCKIKHGESEAKL
jgi:hypothetical protein